MTENDSTDRAGALSRRRFLRSAGAASAGLVLSGVARGQEAAVPAAADINVALIGSGSQGRVLLMDCLKIEGVRFRAVCDIWDYHQRYAANILKRYDQPVNVYVDYREMLAAEGDLDAVIVATPDWMHAEHAIACMDAGLHVYCEKEMANTVEISRSIAQAAAAGDRVVQIGHQRRSNPRYRHAERLIWNDGMLGRITHVSGQWHRPIQHPRGWPKKHPLQPERLERYGYGTMERFRNWRWFRQYSGGPMADLGSHQVDVFNWFLRAAPSAVMASGGVDYYPDREWYDNVIAVYDYETEAGVARGSYEILNTTSYGGYYEAFMGDEGTLIISEDPTRGQIFREVNAEPKEWEDVASKVETMGREAIQLRVGATRRQRAQRGETLGDEAGEKAIHQYHLENFFGAVRGTAELTCPPDVAFETAVSVLRVNDAIDAGRKLSFAPAEFTV